MASKLERFKCDVVCSCGETVGKGFGSEEHAAAYDAGRDAEEAFEHAQRGHSLKLVITVAVAP